MSSPSPCRVAPPRRMRTARRCPASLAKSPLLDSWIRVDADGQDHRLHRQGRARPGHQDGADPDRRARAGRRAVGRRHRHRRHRAHARRGRDGRQPLDAGQRHRDPERRRERARSAGRSGGLALRDRGRPDRNARRRGIRAGRADRRLRRTGLGPVAARDGQAERPAPRGRLEGRSARIWRESTFPPRSAAARPTCRTCACPACCMPASCAGRATARGSSRRISRPSPGCPASCRSCATDASPPSWPTTNGAR